LTGWAVRDCASLGPAAWFAGPSAAMVYGNSPRAVARFANAAYAPAFVRGNKNKALQKSRSKKLQNELSSSELRISDFVSVWITL
jgi:hypothetical protein